jgi:glucan phosphoethanolaminetransferase (alkaline phosphatase superfamily)
MGTEVRLGDKMQTFCQWFIILNIVVNFLLTVHQDINGRERKEPTGFSGFLGTCVVFVIVILIYLGAGVFDNLL